METQSALIAAIVCLALAASFVIKIKGTKRKIYYAFVFLSFSVFLWKSDFFLYAIIGDKFFGKIFYLGYSFLPPAILYFTLHFLLEKDKRAWKVFRTTLVVSFLLFILLFTPPCLKRECGK
jgi:uncharacterized membrane protein